MDSLPGTYIFSRRPGCGCQIPGKGNGFVEMVFWVTAVTAAAGVGGTGLGGLTGAILRRDSRRAVSLLLGFSAGVMTGIVCFDLLNRALPPPSPPLALVLAAVLAGYGMVWLLNAGIQRLPERSGRRSASRLLTAGLVMASAIALHNLPEGMVIGAACAGSGSQGLPTGGVSLAAVIGLHNIPEGMAVAVPLIGGGMNRIKAAAVTALAGFPTVLGALAGYFLGSIGETALVVCLSLAAGAMLYVVFDELVPESLQMWSSRLTAFAMLTGVLVGLAVTYLGCRKCGVRRE